MNGSVLLRRMLLSVLLAAVLCSVGVHASAFWGAGEAERASTLYKSAAEGENGASGSTGIRLLADGNCAPVAENLTLSTYKNVAITGRFAAVDPEGDLLTFQLLDKPARGEITMPEGNETEFVYTPYENKAGKDSFTYIAIDTAGNASDPATVKIKIEKAKTVAFYADMEGNPAHRAAIRLAEEKVLVGECMGGEYFFRPGETVSRNEFIAMAMNTLGVEALTGVERTGFADDQGIAVWAKPYVSAALKNGLVQGSLDETGQAVFRGESPVTAAEAAVLLDRMLQITDSPVTAALETWGAAVPVWAVQSTVNLQSCGVISTDGAGISAPESALNRAETAQLLCGALELLESREENGWIYG